MKDLLVKFATRFGLFTILTGCCGLATRGSEGSMQDADYIHLSGMNPKSAIDEGESAVDEWPSELGAAEIQTGVVTAGIINGSHVSRHLPTIRLGHQRMNHSAS